MKEAYEGLYEKGKIIPKEKIHCRKKAKVLIVFLEEINEDTHLNRAREDFFKTFGSWEDNRSADEIINDIYQARLSRRRDVMFRNTFLITDICVYWLKGRQEVREKIKEMNLDDLAISVITLGELQYGAYNSEKVSENLLRVNKFASFYDIEKSCVEKFAMIKAKLRAKIPTPGRHHQTGRLQAFFKPVYRVRAAYLARDGESEKALLLLKVGSYEGNRT